MTLRKPLRDREVALPQEEKTMGEPASARAAPDAPPRLPLAACESDDVAQERYLRVLQSLIEHAADGKHLYELADALALTFARVAQGCGIGATGDMLAKLGRYIASLEATDRAAREFEREREAGRLPN